MKQEEYIQLDENEKPENNVIGFFKDTDPEFEDYMIGTLIFVAIDEIGDKEGNITCYAPIGQHSAMSIDYLIGDNIKEISKEEYIKYSGRFYTPEEYLK